LCIDEFLIRDVGVGGGADEIIVLLRAFILMGEGILWMM